MGHILGGSSGFALTLSTSVPIGRPQKQSGVTSNFSGEKCASACDAASGQSSSATRFLVSSRFRSVISRLRALFQLQAGRRSPAENTNSKSCLASPLVPSLFSAYEVTTLWRYTSLFIIIIIFVPQVV